MPAYADFIKERFERCLDLYLCPRTRRKRLFVPDAKALVPKLPKPRDLQPFPTTLALRYLGHKAAVSSSGTCLMPESLRQQGLCSCWSVPWFQRNLCSQVSLPLSAWLTGASTKWEVYMASRRLQIVLLSDIRACQGLQGLAGQATTCVRNVSGTQLLRWLFTET